MAVTSSYAWGLQDAFRGFDTARFLKSILPELLVDDGNVDIKTRIRNDNSFVVENGRLINSVKMGED